ncbi:hypothetical protein TRFO_12525 [Tritrichomonas foetus]|uniref:Uncharacterized protein n=1 Tax=Tritrichomonas foetus TaxID=1144522 RepID=A0A1J4L1C1_9EUKA|nr:hypothetical protein TRFO_12525 [Tritrichomonas foetus]|eukprot:OHT17210.1 hypothetical protein TRFO_12525 [Tritrichomonas foetus]
MSKRGKEKKTDSQAFDDATLKLKIRETQMILDHLENNVDQNYFEFLSTLPLFDTLENSSYENSIIQEIEMLDQKDAQKDPLANQKLVNEHVFYKQLQNKMKAHVNDLVEENKRLSAMLK